MNSQQNSPNPPVSPQNKGRKLVTTGHPVILLGGAGPSADTGARDVFSDLLVLRGDAGWPIVAADGGAALGIEAGVIPDAVIGDLDSVTDAHRAMIPPDRLHRIAEQDTTDFDKALRSISAPVVLGAGFHGARLDHQLAAMSVLSRHPDRPCILVGPTDVTCLCPPHIAVDLPVGSWVSLFPMGAVGGQSTGLQWPIDGLRFDPAFKVGTSNQVARAAKDDPDNGRPSGDPGRTKVTLAMEAPLMLLILPRGALRSLLSALLSNAAQWPARG